jgi:hypothetical protein
MTKTVGALRDVVASSLRSVERRTPRQINDTGGGLCEALLIPQVEVYR